MEYRESAIKGCLLGMAVGDAMGYPVDKKNWTEICEDYGPNGLLGYDLANGTAEITSYTQIAAFTGNSLLMGVIRGNPEKYNKYIALGLREWAKGQQYLPESEKTFCWLTRVPEMRRKNCMDTRMLDALSRETLGTPETPVLRSDSPSALTAAVAAGLLYDPERMELKQVGRLGAEAVAFTHGDPETFLSGAVLAYTITGILHRPERTVAQQFLTAAEIVQAQFETYYSRVEKVSALLQKAISLTKDPDISPLAAMSLLECTTASECLAAAAYASIIHAGNFDEGMIAAVNHSGRSAAVGALTGAILGAKLGYEALPEFYLESLEQAAILEELAADLSQGRQMLRIFDDHWDQKYIQGLPSR